MARNQILLLLSRLSILVTGLAGTEDHITNCMLQKAQECQVKGEIVGDENSCTSAWGEWDESHPLYACQLNRQTSNSPLNFSTFHDLPPYGAVAPNVGLFVFREKNFAMCLIPKVGSSAWADVFLKMIEDDTSAGNKFHWLDVAGGVKGTVEQKTAVFSDSRAVRAVFVRDPLARFASAFLDKCVSEVANDRMCPMINIVEHGQPVTMKTAIEYMSATDMHTLNEHWLPQSKFCQLNRRVNEYTFIGLYQEENLGRDASCLMSIAGLDRYNSKGPENGDEPFWSMTDTSSDKPPNDYHSDNTAGETEVLKKLYTTESARTLMNLLKDDYDTFHFPEPSWIEEATGEWYEAVLSFAQYGSPSESPPVSKPQ